MNQRSGTCLTKKQNEMEIRVVISPKFTIRHYRKLGNKYTLRNWIEYNEWRHRVIDECNEMLCGNIVKKTVRKETKNEDENKRELSDGRCG